MMEPCWDLQLWQWRRFSWELVSSLLEELTSVFHSTCSALWETFPCPLYPMATPEVIVGRIPFLGVRLLSQPTCYSQNPGVQMLSVFGRPCLWFPWEFNFFLQIDFWSVCFPLVICASNHIQSFQDMVLKSICMFFASLAHANLCHINISNYKAICSKRLIRQRP